MIRGFWFASIPMSVLMLGAWCVSAPPAVEVDKRDPDFVAQIASVAAIRDVVIEIEAYSLDHNGKLPTDLVSLRATQKLSSDMFIDGWKRSLYYYSTGTSYLVISFGRSGQPDAQEAEPGGLSPNGQFDSDIVLIDGKWAQSATNVDRGL